MTNIQFNEGKFAELVLYISQKCAGDPYFGSTKLNKILYFSDFLSYGRFGESITGAEYQHLAQGPAPRKLLPVRTKLINEDALEIRPVDAGFGFTRQCPTVLRAPRLEAFSGPEIALVDSVIAAVANKSATDVSNLSHLDFGWKNTEIGEIIEYGTVFISSDEPTEFDYHRAAQLDLEVMAAYQ